MNSSVKYSNAQPLNPREAHNPYDRFTETQFQDFIGGITGALRKALGHIDDDSSLVTLPESGGSEYDEELYQEPSSPLHERAAASPAYSGRGGRDEPIEILSDEDAEEENELFTENSSYDGQENRQAEVERGDEDEWSGDENDLEQPHRRHYTRDEDVDFSEEYEGGDEEDGYGSDRAATRPSYADEESENQEDEYDAQQPFDEYDELQPIDEDTSFPPPRNDDEDSEGTPEIMDPWRGVEAYAEDYYAGGDYLGRSPLDVNRLGMESQNGDVDDFLTPDYPSPAPSRDESPREPDRGIIAHYAEIIDVDAEDSSAEEDDGLPGSSPPAGSPFSSPTQMEKSFDDIDDMYYDEDAESEPDPDYEGGNVEQEFEAQADDDEEEDGEDEDYGPTPLGTSDLDISSDFQARDQREDNKDAVIPQPSSRYAEHDEEDVIEPSEDESHEDLHPLGDIDVRSSTAGPNELIEYHVEEPSSGGPLTPAEPDEASQNAVESDRTRLSDYANDVDYFTSKPLKTPRTNEEQFPTPYSDLQEFLDVQVDSGTPVCPDSPSLKPAMMPTPGTPFALSRQATPPVFLGNSILKGPLNRDQSPVVNEPQDEVTSVPDNTLCSPTNEVPGIRQGEIPTIDEAVEPDEAQDASNEDFLPIELNGQDLEHHKENSIFEDDPIAVQPTFAPADSEVSENDTALNTRMLTKAPLDQASAMPFFFSEVEEAPQTFERENLLSQQPAYDAEPHPLTGSTGDDALVSPQSAFTGYNTVGKEREASEEEPIPVTPDELSGPPPSEGQSEASNFMDAGPGFAIDAITGNSGDDLELSYPLEMVSGLDEDAEGVEDANVEEERESPSVDPMSMIEETPQEEVQMDPFDTFDSAFAGQSPQSLSQEQDGAAVSSGDQTIDLPTSEQVESFVKSLDEAAPKTDKETGGDDNPFESMGDGSTVAPGAVEDDTLSGESSEVEGSPTPVVEETTSSSGQNGAARESEPPADSSPSGKAASASSSSGQSPEPSRPAKRKRENVIEPETSKAPRLTRSMSSRFHLNGSPESNGSILNGKGKTKSSSSRRGSDVKVGPKGKGKGVRQLSEQPSESSSSSSSGLSVAARLLRTDSALSRSSSVSADSRRSSREASPAVVEPKGDLAPPPPPARQVSMRSVALVSLFHKHGGSRNRTQLPTIETSPAKAQSPTKANLTRAKSSTSTSPVPARETSVSPSEAESPSPTASENSQVAPAPVRQSRQGATTRSNCRYHKICIPREEQGPLMYFLVPGCSLSNKNDMRELEVEDLGEATPDDAQHAVADIESLGFTPELLADMKQLVGVELVREQEIFYLPLPGERLEHPAPLHKRVLSRDFGKGGRNSPQSSTSKLEKKIRSPISRTGSTSTSSSNVIEGLDSPGAESQEESPKAKPVSTTRRSTKPSLGRKRRLPKDALAYQPSSESGISSDSDTELDERKPRKRKGRGIKRSRLSEAVRDAGSSEGRESKKPKLASSTPLD